MNKPNMGPSSKILLCFMLTLQVLLLATSTCADEKSPLVKTSEGELLGKNLISRNGRNYYAFLGVPYAKSPERFKDPELPSKWSGVRNATEFGAICAQESWPFDYIDAPAGSEDCLFLNIFTPKIEGNSKFPVMMFIHGGAFQFGTGNAYGGKYFVDHDVVLVTINYRLGAFGFLNTEDGVVGGNMGLKDQVMALKYIQRNIAHFNGDPNQVTIFGESAGGASSTLHMVSPLSKGLFHRVIAQSGTFINPWATLPKPKYFAESLAKKLGCPIETSRALVDCLKEKDALEIAKQNFRKWHFDTHIPFGPSIESVDNENPNKNIFLSQNAMELFQEGKFENVPVLMGIMQEEGLLYYSAGVLKDEKLTKELDEDWNRVAPITLVYDKDEQAFTKSEEEKLNQEIRKYYFQDKPIGMQTATSLREMYSDRWFIHGVRTCAVLLAKNNKSSVYMYMMNYEGENSVLDLLGIESRTGVNAGATHADDLQYLFNTDYFPKPLEQNSVDFSKKIVKIWVDFASTGQLTIDGQKLDSMRPNQEPTYYEINNEPVKIFKSPYNARMKLWDNLLGYKIETSDVKTEL